MALPLEALRFIRFAKYMASAMADDSRCERYAAGSRRDRMEDISPVLSNRRILLAIIGLYFTVPDGLTKRSIGLLRCSIFRNDPKPGSSLKGEQMYVGCEKRYSTCCAKSGSDAEIGTTRKRSRSVDIGVALRESEPPMYAASMTLLSKRSGRDG